MYVQFLRFDGNGTLAVAEGWNAEYGRTTESYYVAPDPPSAYIDEDGLDWDSENPLKARDSMMTETALKRDTTSLREVRMTMITGMAWPATCSG